MFIYAHINKLNNKAYIGQTSEENILHRWGSNGSRYLEKTPEGNYKHPKFAAAINKYGWNNFEHIILIECTSENADHFENYYIEKYNSMENGYNCTSGGNKKKKLSKETKEKLSKSHKKENLSKKAIQNYSDAHKGKSPYNKGMHYNCIKLQGKNNPMYGKKPHNFNKGFIVEGINIITKEKIIANTMREAAEIVGLKTSSPIQKAVKGLRQTAGGYTWKILKNNLITYND